jgi:hypothetical protein
MPKERLQVKTPSGLDVGERRVAVDAVVPKEVFGEVLDSNPVHLRSEGLAAFDLRQPLAQEASGLGRVGSPAGLAERLAGKVVFDP